MNRYHFLSSIKIIVILLISHIGIFMSNAVAQTASYYTWPEYSPTVEYDFEDDFGKLDPPTMVMDDVTGVAGTYIDRWWCFRWGENLNPEITEADWVPMLERLNTDFAYITDVMGWPRDKKAQNGYYSTVYLFGSGMSTDGADMWDTGGWQGTTSYNDDWWPMILASYYPVQCFDENYAGGDGGYQTGAMVHEGIHCILSGMPGCKNSCWFHEGGNTWLQATMEAQRSGSYTGMGWLSVGSAIAPFMPIECYTGWLQDGSFGGPCAQGVYQGDGVCTWRNLLGGAQYSEAFPHAMEVILGPKSVAWVWNNAKYSGRVLQDLAEAPGGLGGDQVRRLIQEYRGRQAFCDFGLWSYAYRQLLHGAWKVTIQEEWEPSWIDVEPWIATCYVKTTRDGDTLTPDPITLPGWSGANQIPLRIDTEASEATVIFNPIGENMSCQLVYRDISGNVQYGEPVSSGPCSIPLNNVRNNVVIAVICNTDYIYVDDTTRQAKYDYTLTIADGISGTADIYSKWFDYNPSRYTITASSGVNGTISPSGATSATPGSSRTFNFIPDTGYEVKEVILNGYGIGKMDSYTLNNIRGGCTVSVEFRQIGLETDPPTPNPLSWETAPASIGTDTIYMKATEATDTSGTVEYYFEETSGNTGGSDSEWQTSPEYIDYDLTEGELYTYRVRTRDAYENKGYWSESISTQTHFSGEKNLALTASVDTFHVSAWETLGAVNDNYIPTDSGDNSHGAYGNWDNTNNVWKWVEYDFGTPYKINTTRVYWWVDGGGILQPYGAYIEYWDGSDWVNAGNIGRTMDQWNTFNADFTTSKIRINMVSTISTGILEWQVWGEVAAPSFSSDPITAINATESYAYNNSLADNVSDPSNTALTFAKDSGPEWLTIASNGGLTGTPSNSDVGENTFQVHVTNEIGLFDIARMTIDVDNVYSGTQGMEDLLGFAAQWLKTDCIDTPACDGADLNDDNNVNIIDFAILAYNWIIE